MIELFLIYGLITLLTNPTQYEKGIPTNVLTIFFPDFGGNIIDAAQYTGLNPIKNIKFKTAPLLLYNVWQEYESPHDTTQDPNLVPFYDFWSWTLNYLKYNYFYYIYNIFTGGYWNHYYYENFDFERSFYSINDFRSINVSFYEKTIKRASKSKGNPLTLIVLFSKGKGASVLLDFIFKTPPHILDEFPINLIIVEDLDKSYQIPKSSSWYGHIPLVNSGYKINKNFSKKLRSMRPDLPIFDIEFGTPWRDFYGPQMYKKKIEGIYSDLIYHGRGYCSNHVYDPKRGRLESPNLLHNYDNDGTYNCCFLGNCCLREFSNSTF